jgi:hypothetical protein
MNFLKIHAVQNHDQGEDKKYLQADIFRNEEQKSLRWLALINGEHIFQAKITKVSFLRQFYCPSKWRPRTKGIFLVMPNQTKREMQVPMSLTLHFLPDEF